VSRAVIHITGARPNFPKAAPVLRALASRGATQLLVHTGQHYDDRMSAIFFEELGLPQPDLNLGVGSGTHARQTAAIMVGLEDLFTERGPALVMVYGDVNSTVAAALVAAKMRIPLAHVEAGLRSFDMTMPEEVNRLVTDQLSDLLFVTSPDAIAHLADEGIHPDRIRFVGNPMIDTLLANLDKCDTAAARSAHGVPREYLVATLHRPSNVDDQQSAADLVGVLDRAARSAPIVFPLHPRGRATLAAAGLLDNPRIIVTDPLPYLEFISLVRGARAVLTDSGGIQEETTVLGVPCLTLRPNTERPITITHGTNRLVSREGVFDALAAVMAEGPARVGRVPPLWDGHAGERIADEVMTWLGQAR
jgi:UDP-N-acetylglucosamine 2-epimerase (non-hydrolysing)